MTETEYQALCRKPERAVLSATDLQDKTPRTLLYGYTTARDTFHVYLDPLGCIHVLVYCDITRLPLTHTAGPAGGVSRNEDYVPDKRLYPERCDAEFCRLLTRVGVTLPFTTFDATRQGGRTTYEGCVTEDLQPATTLEVAAVAGLSPIRQLARIALEEAAFELGQPLHKLTEDRFVLPTNVLTEVLNRARELTLEQEGDELADPKVYLDQLLGISLGEYQAEVFTSGFEGGVLVAQVAAQDTLLDSVLALADYGIRVEAIGQREGLRVKGSLNESAKFDFAIQPMFDGLPQGDSWRRFVVLMPLYASEKGFNKRLGTYLR